MKSRYELLLITVLSAMLLTLNLGAIGKREVSASRTRCAASLHEVYRMANAYSADHDDFIVPCLERRQREVTFWAAKLRDYAKNFRDFSCPDNRRHGAQAFVDSDLLPSYFALGNVSFGINGHISGLDRSNRRNERFANLKNPKALIYFGDANTMLLRALAKTWPRDWAPVHDGGMQAVMADGSIRYFTRDTLGTFGPIPGWRRDIARWKNFTTK